MTPLFNAIISIIILSLTSITATAQTTKSTEVPIASIIGAPSPLAPVNFDGTYQRRGANGDCCYELVDVATGQKTGVLRANADLMISGNSGTFIQFSNPKLKLDAACALQKFPVEVLEKHRNTIVLLIKKEQLQIFNCKDELITLVLNSIDGEAGLSAPKRQEILMYKKVVN